jgi:hypothetical protein
MTTDGMGMSDEIEVVLTREEPKTFHEQMEEERKKEPKEEETY